MKTYQDLFAQQDARISESKKKSLDSGMLLELTERQNQLLMTIQNAKNLENEKMIQSLIKLASTPIYVEKDRCALF